MNLIGYTDRFSVRPGELVDVKISADVEAFRASLVRLREPMIGDRPIAPANLESNFDGKYPGRHQEIPIGSFMRVDGLSSTMIGDGLGFVCWIMPALPNSGEPQGIVSWLDDGMLPAISLGLDEEGCLEFEAGPTQCKTVGPLVAHRWYFVAAVWNQPAGRIALRCQMEQRSWLKPQRIVSDSSVHEESGNPGATLVVGARQLVSAGPGR